MYILPQLIVQIPGSHHGPTKSEEKKWRDEKPLNVFDLCNFTIDDLGDVCESTQNWNTAGC